MNRVSRLKIRLSLTAIGVVVGSLAAFAEHPIEVERFCSEGKHLQALVAFERIPTRTKNPQTMISAGKSAWALGLTVKAAEYLDTAVRQSNGALSKEDEARALLTRGIIEFQENNIESAIYFGKNALEKSTNIAGLNNAVNLLLGDVHQAKGDFTSAERYYSAALIGVTPNERGEVEYRLGVTQAALGNNNGALTAYQGVPVDSERAPDSVREMARISFELGKYDDAIFWLTKGRTEYPDKFLDSWVDFKLVESAIHKDDITAADDYAMRARASFPPSEAWMALLEGSLEHAKWKKSAGEDSNITKKEGEK